MTYAYLRFQTESNIKLMKPFFLIGPNQIILLLFFISIWILLNAPGIYLGIKAAKMTNKKFYASGDFYLLVLVGPILVGVFHYIIVQNGNTAILNLCRLASLPLAAPILYRFRYKAKIEVPKIDVKSEWFEWTFILIYGFLFLLMLSDWMTL